MRFLLSAILLLFPTLSLAQPVPAGQKVFATGRVEPKNLKQLHEQSHLLYGHKLKNLPKVTAASWDCRTLGLVGPVQDQGNCFPPGTKVMMASYQERNIEDVQIGNSVISSNGNIKLVTQVTQRPVREKLYRLTVSKGEFSTELRATADHPILTTQGWVLIKHLKSTDLVIFPELDLTPAEERGPKHIRGPPVWLHVKVELEAKEYVGQVYNLTVQDDHGYIANYVGVHNCGSCWDFSGADICTSSLYKNGTFKNDGTPATYLSQQHVLDCVQSGGCNGDDNTTVTAAFVRNGLPTQADYGPYRASEGRCKTGLKMYMGKDTGFCTTSNSQGVASVQDIKNAMVAYGPQGSAIAADNAFMNVRPGQVFHGNSHSINHDIVLVGWDDSKAWSPDMPAEVLAHLTAMAVKEGRKAGQGAWILRNSWGSSWCDGGYCWIAYGANDVGTEAIWVTAGAPPTPPAAPVITSATSAPAVVGTQFLYQIVASNAPGVFGASGLPGGLTLATDKGVITGIPTTAGTFNVTLSAANVAGVGTAPLVVTVSGGPVPPVPPSPAGAPVITSATTATVAPGAAFSYQIAATNSPIAYNAANLPAGLTVSQATGLVSGTVQTAGTYSCQVMALNFSGVGSAPLTITVGTGPVPGNITIGIRDIVISNVTQGEVVKILSDIGIKKEMTLGDFTGFMGRCFPMAPPPAMKQTTLREPPLAPDDGDDGDGLVMLRTNPRVVPVDRRLMPARSR